jgi:hypothetical protein
MKPKIYRIPAHQVIPFHIGKDWSKFEPDNWILDQRESRDLLIGILWGLAISIPIWILIFAAFRGWAR